MNINIEIFKRNIKLQELGIDKLYTKEQKLLDFLNEELTNLNTYTSDKYISVLFLGRDKDNIILTYNEKSGDLYVSYSKIWLLFESTFNMEYDEIKELMTWWVGSNLHLKVTHTFKTNKIWNSVFKGK